MKGSKDDHVIKKGDHKTSGGGPPKFTSKPGKVDASKPKVEGLTNIGYFGVLG